MKHPAREWMVKGAKIGALSLSVTGFAGGVGLCLALDHPVPPIFTTEIGLIAGASLGALVGWLCAEPTARMVVVGTLFGGFFGVLAGVVTWGLPPLSTIAGSACVGAFLGLQAASRVPLSADRSWTAPSS